MGKLSVKENKSRESILKEIRYAKGTSILSNCE